MRSDNTTTDGLDKAFKRGHPELKGLEAGPMNDPTGSAHADNAHPAADSLNPKLDRLINRLRSVLEPVQRLENATFTAPRHPVVVIIGCPRSGTTLASQLLASSGSFAYPTNVLARFAYAPLLGAMIQKLLFDPDLGCFNELADIQSAEPFRSVFGRTSGAMAVNQFFHFWRRFVPSPVPSHLTDEDLARVDLTGLRQELAAIESVFEKPFMSKGKLLQFRAHYFATRMPELLFVQIRRRPRFVMQSIIIARRALHGTDRIWWSHRPREFEWLATMDPAHQVAGQVLYTERAIACELAGVAEDRKLVLDYESLCGKPHELHDRLRETLARHGSPVEPPATPRGSFSARDLDTLPSSEVRALEAAYAELERAAVPPDSAC
jgi:hypothetical protein